MAINHQKLPRKCLLTSLFIAAQILNSSHGHRRTLVVLMIIRRVTHGDLLLTDSPHELALHVTTRRIGWRKRIPENIADAMEQPQNTEEIRRVTSTMAQEKLCVAIALSGRLRQPVLRRVLILSYLFPLEV